MGEIGANFNFASLFHYTQELCIKKNIFWLVGGIGGREKK